MNLLPLLDASTLTPLLLPSWFDPAVLVNAMGNGALVGVCLILFVECALFPVLPGDSLLFTVGLLTAMNPPSITMGGLSKPLTMVVVCCIMTVAAVAGNVAGYYVGRFISPWLFKPRSGPAGRVFSQENLQKSHDFFERYGSKALVLGRFVPVVRTFVTMVAGASRMPFRHFITWTAVGGVAWVWIVALAGYLLGGITFVGNNIDLILVLMVVITTIPIVIEYYREKNAAQGSLG